MTLITSGYTVGSNEPLNHTRILWDFKPGSATGDGNGAELAANDYTAQRWVTTGAGDWTFEFDANTPVDTFFIAGHNLAGKAITIGTSGATTGGLTARATFTPSDNTPIFVMVNTGTGLDLDVRRYRVSVPSASNAAIIRAGKALQMQRAIYGGHNPALWSRVTEGQQSFSETGQWLGRTKKRMAYSTAYNWQHITAPWYRDNFEPFAQTLPLKPFAIAGNPAKMSYDVAWAWAQGDVSPQNMGVRNFVTMGMQVTGYAG
ncbi:hypothetical protein [Yoonia sp.]|uniref:hypothetical protein n=1 Tax=Yoonia sp. TaxID=2212373 RepID=UPI002DFD4C82|nr:hypothetical protein [Yoonia sp.]